MNEKSITEIILEESEKRQKMLEEAIRKDEREKIIDALWLSIANDKKIIFEKDGHKFELNLVPIINSEVEQ